MASGPPLDNGTSSNPESHPAVTYEPGWQVGEQQPPVRPEWVQVVLFLATCLTTTLAGVQASPVFSRRYADRDLELLDLFLPENLILGVPFSASLLLILGIHEMGHFIAARRWHVRATLPYFIPIPTIIGTMGAVIRIRSRIPNRRALFDIGVSGPLAGFILSVAALCCGFSTAEVVSMHEFEGKGALVFGDSLLTSTLQYLIVGEIPPGHDLLLEPIGFAGWLGLFVTVLNLLPIGQFDGGHLVYAMFGKRHEMVAKATIVGLFGMWMFGPEYGWLTAADPMSTWLESRWPGWIIWGIISIVMGRRHPPTLDPYTGLDDRRRWIGYGTTVIFVLCFIPNPIRWMSP
ncbi:MAG: site-2 protease family protein [Gemmatimonadetes bacterium]|nr:site-2 protease family protein [Gemmatimonadota bacterium]